MMGLFDLFRKKTRQNQSVGENLIGDDKQKDFSYPDFYEDDEYLFIGKNTSEFDLNDFPRVNEYMLEPYMEGRLICIENSSSPFVYSEGMFYFRDVYYGRGPAPTNWIRLLVVPSKFEDINQWITAVNSRKPDDRYKDVASFTKICLFGRLKQVSKETANSGWALVDAFLTFSKDKINRLFYNAKRYDYIYEKKAEESLILKRYLGKSESVIIPQRIEQYSVDEIDNSAFEYNKIIESIEIPISVKTLGTDIVLGCTHLINIKIDESLWKKNKKAFRISSYDYSLPNYQLTFYSHNDSVADQGVEKKNIPEYEKILFQTFCEIVTKNRLDHDGECEYFSDIYQPVEFCKKAYLYCNTKYSNLGIEKVMFEYCMTAFYGCICSVALWKSDETQFSGRSVWDVIYQQINVEFTDANAERLLNTRQGEDLAEGIYSIISDYFSVAKGVMAREFTEDVCLLAMQLAYKLGMLIAKRHVQITNKPYSKELLERENNRKRTDKTEEEMVETPAKFYTKCVMCFHDRAVECGYAKHGVIYIPELMPIGEKTVIEFLQDEFFINELGNNPRQYYYLIMGLSIQAGIVFAERWHTNFSGLNNDFVEKVIKEGPADMASQIMKIALDINTNKDQNDFFYPIYEEWVKCHEPYWSAQNATMYTFREMMAAYQLGISIILSVYGY